MGVPLLPSDPPPLVSDIEAKDLMNTKVVSFPTLVSVHHIMEILGRNKHQGFPVVQEYPGAEVCCSYFSNILKNVISKF